MVLKKSPTIKTETLERNIRAAKALISLQEDLTKEQVLKILNELEVSCYQYVPETELELFRLPKGMVMGGI